jgi:hypothetical protein
VNRGVTVIHGNVAREVIKEKITDVKGTVKRKLFSLADSSCVDRSGESE